MKQTFVFGGNLGMFSAFGTTHAGLRSAGFGLGGRPAARFRLAAGEALLLPCGWSHQVTTTGTHAVQTKMYSVPALTATGGTKAAEVYAPKEPGVYPYISFAHGIIDDGYDTLMRDLAAYGFIVSNMKTCAGEPV